LKRRHLILILVDYTQFLLMDGCECLNANDMSYLAADFIAVMRLFYKPLWHNNTIVSTPLIWLL